jgi:hypothetical protein
MSRNSLAHQIPKEFDYSFAILKRFYAGRGPRSLPPEQEHQDK